MVNIRKIIVFAVIACSAWGAPTHFTIAADPDYAPFTFRDANGKPAGLFIDLWNLWAEENNYTVQYRFYDWNDTLRATQTGEVDFHSGTSYDYPWMHVSAPIYEVKTALYTVDDRTHIPTNETLKGLTVGVIDPYYGDMVRHACHNTCTVTVYNTYNRLMNAALGGEIDALVDDVDALTYYFIRNGILSRFIKQPIALHRNDLVYAVTNAEKRSLLPLINEGLRRVPPAKLLEIENRWFPNVSDGYYRHLYGEEYSTKTYLPSIVWAIVALLVFLLAYLYHLRKLHRQALDESLKDELTGLNNKRAFERFTHPNAKNIALLFIDVDHFKEYNDTYGHLAGDELLRRVAAVLNDTVGTNASTYRIGGDEFVVLLFDSNADAAKRIGQAILKTIQNQALPHKHNPYGIVTVTVGASLSTLPVARDRIVMCADKALYAAKHQGKNRFVFLPCEESERNVTT